jgi:hypothetical protein
MQISATALVYKLEADECLELIDTRLIRLRRYFGEGRAGPVGYGVAIGARATVDRVVEDVDHVDPELQHQRLIDAR